MSNATELEDQSLDYLKGLRDGLVEAGATAEPAVDVKELKCAHYDLIQRMAWHQQQFLALQQEAAKIEQTIAQAEIPR